LILAPDTEPGRERKKNERIAMADKVQRPEMKDDESDDQQTTIKSKFSAEIERTDVDDNKGNQYYFNFRGLDESEPRG
jgi:hypothetical protein